MQRNPVELIKLGDVVKNDVFKNDVCNAQIKNIEDKIPDINYLATNATVNAKINELKKKLILATTAALNAKTNEVKNKIPNIINIAIPTALTAVENKIRNSSKYITTPEFNRFLAENCAARLAQPNLASKSNIACFVKKTDFDDKLKYLDNKITSNKTKHVLIENELNKLSEKVKAISTKRLTKDLVNT